MRENAERSVTRRKKEGDILRMGEVSKLLASDAVGGVIGKALDDA